MRKVVLIFFLVIFVTGIYLGSRNSHESMDNKSITSNGKGTKKIVHQLGERTKIDKQNTVSKVSHESVDNEMETFKKISSNSIYDSSFWTDNVEKLINWIKSADSNDARKHFLEYARKKKKILVVESKESGYQLNSIMVPPDYEYMTYIFSKGQKCICVNVNLSDKMKQQMSDSKKNYSLEKVMTNYNKKLKETYKNFQYKKDEIEILNEKTIIYYNDGKYYEKLNGETKLISPGAFFEICNTEVRMTLYADLKEEKWDNKYLKLFKFKVVELA